jgi:GT2 family glycosyltransferase
MAVFNGEDYVRQAAASVLSQDDTEFEFLIVDDGSTDGTAAILDELKTDKRVRVLKNPANIGLANSLNRALSEIETPYVLRMDADDISLPGHIRIQLEEIVRNDADLCFCRFYNFKPETGRERVWPDVGELRHWRVLFDNYYGPHCGVIYRRDAVLATKGYDPSFERAEDYDLWDRCVEAGHKICRHEQPLIRVREHGEGVTRKHFSETVERSAGVSRRAVKRVLPGLGDEELDGLRWLMLRRQDTVPPAVAEAGLRQCFFLAEEFIKKENFADPPAVWNDLSISLAVKYRTFTGRLRTEGRRQLVQASWRARSLYALARCLRALLG